MDNFSSFPLYRKNMTLFKNSYSIFLSCMSYLFSDEVDLLFLFLMAEFPHIFSIKQFSIPHHDPFFAAI
jgi:hypothetical protein